MTVCMTWTNSNVLFVRYYFIENLKNTEDKQIGYHDNVIMCSPEGDYSAITGVCDSHNIHISTFPLY